MLFSTTALAFASSVALGAPHVSAAPGTDLPQGAVVASSIDDHPVAIILPSKGANASRQDWSGADAPHGKRIAFNNLSKDRNAQFLSWYGYTVSGYSYYSSSDSGVTLWSGYTRIAIPIVGSGKAVSTIRVPEVSGEFTVVLYTDAGGVPGTPISGATDSGTGTGSGYCCTQLLTVPIHPTTLNSATQYWLVETGVRKRDSKTQSTWLAEDTDYTGDGKMLTQYHRYLYRSHNNTGTNYTSGWEGTTGNWTEPAALVY